MGANDIEQKILSWLDTQGYGLEMKVASALDAAGCQVIQAHLYIDPETGASREIDVIGRMSDEVGLLRVYAVVECKKRSRPWVLFTSEKASFNRISAFAIKTDIADRALFDEAANMLEIGWFRKDGRIAYGI